MIVGTPIIESDDSTENLTIYHVNQLKLALNKEKEKLNQQRNLTDDLKKDINRYDEILSSEKMISRLSFLSCTTGGGKDPFFVVDTMKELLFSSYKNDFLVWCCIRTGDNWTVVRNSSNQGNDNYDIEILGKISIATFDGMTRTLQIGSLHFLSDILSIDEINKILIEGNSKLQSNKFHDACMIRINSRCVWLFWNAEYLRDVSNIISNYFSVVDAASQLTMAALVHYSEHQELVAEQLAGKAVAEITKILYNETIFEDSKGVLLEKLQQLPNSIKSLISPISSCDIFLFDGLHTLSTSQSSTKNVTDKIIAINTDLEVTIIDSTDGDNSYTTPSLLATAVSKQQPICCFDSLNPNRNKSIDCGGISTGSIIACPLWPTNVSGRILSGGIVYRFENGRPSSTDIRSMIAVANSIGPILQNWFESTEMGALSLLLHQPKLPFESTIFSKATNLKLNDMEDSTQSSFIEDIGAFYNRVIEYGLSGLVMDGFSMQSIARAFGCDWSLAILQNNSIAENFDDSNLEIVNNIGLRRSFNIQEIDNFLRRTVAYMLQDQTSENELEMEIISGIDADNSGVLQLLNINSMRAAILATLPVHLHHIMCFSISDSLTNSADNSIKKVIYVIGRNWHPLSRTSLLPIVKTLSENVTAALECRYLRSMYKFTEIIQDKVHVMEYSKVNDARIKLLDRELQNIAENYRKDYSGSNARKQLKEAINKFCYQQIILEDLENIFDISFNSHNSSSLLIVRDKVNDYERYWKMAESGEWILDPSLEKFAKVVGGDDFNKVLTICTDQRSFESASTFSLTLELVLPYSNNEKSKNTANLNDILLVQELRERLEDFLKRHELAIFGCLEELSLSNNSFNVDGIASTESPFTIKAIDYGVKTFGKILSYGLSIDNAIASESFIKGIKELVPQFLLFPVTWTMDSRGIKENFSIAYMSNSSSIAFAQLPVRVVKILSNDDSIKSRNISRSTMILLNGMGAVFHNFLLDCGLDPASNQNSTLILYRYYYRGIINRYDYVEFLAISRSNLLVAPCHFLRLNHLIDCALLPLQLNYVTNSLTTLVSSSASLFSMKGSLEGTKMSKLLIPFETFDESKDESDKGFIEEALHIVSKQVDDTYQFRKSYSVCISTMKSLMAYGRSMIGYQCFASAAYFLPLDEMLSLLQNKEFDFTESLQLCYSNGVQLAEDSFWNPVKSQNYNFSGSEAIIDVDILDAIDLEGKLIGLGKGLYSLFNATDQENVSLKVICISISLSSSAFRLDDEVSQSTQKNITIATALFWFHHESSISFENFLPRVSPLDTLVEGCSEYMLRQLFLIAGSLMTFDIRSSLHSTKALKATSSLLVDEVSKRLASQSVFNYFKSILDSNSTGKPSNLSHGYIQELRKRGYVDKDISSTLYNVEMLIIENYDTQKELRDEIEKQLSQNDDLHRLLVASQLKNTEFTEFIAAINKMCSNDAIGQFTDQDALTSDTMLQAFVLIALNNFTLQSAVKLLCDLGYHEHVTVNLRSLIISLFGNDADKDITSWLHRADAFVNAARSATELVKNGNIHQDESLVIAWCLDQKVDTHVKGVRSWDMLSRALESTSSLVVEDKDASSVTTYHPINNCAVLQHTFQDKAQPGASIALDFTQMLVSSMGSQMQQSESFKRLQHHHDNMFYQKWSDYRNHILSDDPMTLFEKLENVANLLHDNVDATDTRLIDLISYRVATISGHEGTLLLPYSNDSEEGEKFYVGHVFNSSHDKYKISIPLEKLEPFLKKEMLNKPNLVLSESLLSTGSKYIVSLPLVIEGVGFQKVVILIAESDIRPKASSLLEMKVLSDELTVVTSKIRLRKDEVVYSQELNTQISCLDQTILSQQTLLNVLERKLACKSIYSDITLCKDLVDLDSLLKQKLPAVMDAYSVSLVRVTKSTLDNHGSIVHGEGEGATKEFNSIDGEKLAACLISNSSVVASDTELSDNITGIFGIVYVPILYHLAKGNYQLSQEDALDDFDYCWVLKSSFNDINSLNYFKDINFNSESKGDDICNLVQEIKRWMRSYRHKLISHFRSQTLNILGSICEQFTNGMYLMSLYQNDGYVAEVEGFAAASTQIFNISNLNNVKQYIQSARLHWFIDSSLETSVFNKALKTESNWYTCDLPNSKKPIVDAPTVRDAVFGSMVTVDNELIYDYDILQQMLRVSKWNKRLSLIPNDLQSTVQDSKGFIYKSSIDKDDEPSPSLFISVGNSQQPMVFQIILSKGSRLMANAEDTKSVVHLLRETISQSLVFMQKLKLANGSLLAGECEARLTRRLLRIKSRCYNEICAEATSGYNISTLCSGVQALLVKQPGVHSVWLSCIDTLNGSIMYQQLCGVQSVLSLSNDDISPVTIQSDSNTFVSLGISSSTKLSPSKKNNDNTDIYWSTDLPSGRKNHEFVLECREMAGRLVIYYLTDDELRAASDLTAKRTNYVEAKNIDMKDYTLGMGYDAEILQWLITKSDVYQQLEREVIRGLCRTLARRIFELNKGQQNKQLLIDRKNDLLSHKTKLENAEVDIKKLEQTKESLVIQLEQSLADAANLKSRLRDEQEQSAILERKNRDVQRSTSATLYDLRNECARKDALLQRSLIAVQEERKLGEERREAVILDLQRALDGERSAETARRQAYLELKTLEKQCQKQASSNDMLVKSLQRDVEILTEKERASTDAYEKRLTVLLNKLRDAEEEVLSSRQLIKQLRKELHILTAFDGN